MKQREESMTLMTSYRFPHHDNRSFNHALDDDFPSVVILNGGKIFERKAGNGAVALSDESIPLLTLSGQQLIFQSLLPEFCLTSDCLRRSAAS